MNSFMMRLRGCGWVALVCAGACAVSSTEGAITVDPAYATEYIATSLGSVPGVPASYGGAMLDRTNPNVLLIGGAANGASSAIYSIALTRDVNGHINGFSGSASIHSAAPYIDGGLTYGPGGVIFFTGFPTNTIGQIKPGSTAPDKTVNPAVSSSVGSLLFVPAGQPGAGQLKILSYSGGGWYDASVSPDGFGTYDITVNGSAIAVGSGPEGAIYVPNGSPLFPDPTILVSLYGAGKIVAFDADANGDPIPATVRDFVTGLSGAEGAFIDPLTGDFLFSTFGGGNQLVVVSGFVPVPEPASIALLASGGLLLARRRHR
jgi:hypothetical protein